MLILTRRFREVLVLSPADGIDPNMTVRKLFANGPIEIAVLNISRNQAQVVASAPPAITILREELYEPELPTTGDCSADQNSS